MAFIYRDWRILASMLVAACLIVGAYVLAAVASKPPIAEAATETALLQAVAAKDSTGDGLPDWEKSLYGIPLNATSTDYFGLGMTDGEAAAKGLIVPKASGPAAPAPSAPQGSVSVGGENAPATGSLTDLFAKQFFTLFVSAEQDAGGSLTSDQINALADQALSQLESSITPAPDFKTASDIKVSGSGPDALRAYAAAAQEVFAAHSAKLPRSELTYLQDYMNGDKSALANLRTIATAYTDTAVGLAALSVPKEAVQAHLALVNATARIGSITHDFSTVDADPLATMLALNQYPDAVVALGMGFKSVGAIFATAQVSFTQGMPGAEFVNLIQALPTVPTSP